ncbi:MAG TPA: hypothetical protein DD490_31580, partial [Acidobacteria bacterium]|nr:hypothetical protein [Acidobacteriota bacterium]
QGLRPPVDHPVIRLQTGSRVAGRVLDATGDPVAGAKVRLTWQGTVGGLPAGGAVYRDTGTDSAGHFEIRDSPAGTVQIAASAPGFVESSPVEWTVPAPPGTELAIRLRRGLALQGLIRTTDGEPVAGARVTVGNAGGRSDAEGFYHLEGAKPGSVLAELFHPAYGRQQRRVTLETETTTLDFELEAGRRISGRVVDEDGRPVSAAQVTLETPQRNRSYRIYQVWSALDGRFEISSVAPGEYQAGAEAEGFAPAPASPLLMGESEIEDLELVLGRSGSVVGQILGLDPEQLARVQVAADDDRMGRPGQIDAQGRFAIRDLPASTWELTARLSGEQRQVQARVVLAAGETVVRDLEFGNRLTLSGHVEYNGGPLSGAAVAIRASHFTLERNVTTGFDGGFRIEDLEPDTYWLGVSHSREILTHNETLTLSADRDVVIRLDAGSLSGRVRDDATGEPVAGTLVQLHPEDGPDFLIAGSADAAGHFHLPRVPAGRYTLLAKADGYSPAQLGVEVPGNQPGDEVEVALEAVQGLEIHVRLASGSIPGWIDVRAESLPGGPAFTERRQVAKDGSVRLPTLAAGTWALFLGTAGGGLVELTATVPGPPVGVTFPNAAPLQIQVPALAESSLVGTARLVGGTGTVLATLSSTGQLATETPVTGGIAIVDNVPAGVWKIQVDAPDGRRWNAVASTDGHSGISVQLE